MKLSINTSTNYDIIIKSELLDQIDKYLDEFNSGQLFIICYPPFLLSKAQKMHLFLKNKNYSIELLEILDGEQQKGFDNIQFILQKLIDLNAKRDSILLGFGGGSIGDIIGFGAPFRGKALSFGFVFSQLWWIVLASTLSMENIHTFPRAGARSPQGVTRNSPPPPPGPRSRRRGRPRRRPFPFPATASPFQHRSRSSSSGRGMRRPHSLNELKHPW